MGFTTIEPLSNEEPYKSRHPSTWCLPGMTWGWKAMREIHFDVRTRAAGEEWSDWRNFTPGVELRCQFYQVRMTIKTDSPWIPIEIEKFKLVFDLPERFDAQQVQFEDETYKRVLFNEEFFELDSIVGTAEDDVNVHIPEVDVVGFTVSTGLAGGTMNTGFTYSGIVNVAAFGV